LIRLALALVLLSGCGGSTSNATRATVTQKQLVDQLVIALEAPAQPRLLAEEDLMVTLTDAAGKPVEGAQVWLELVMPTMHAAQSERTGRSIGRPGSLHRSRAIYHGWNVEYGGSRDGAGSGIYRNLSRAGRLNGQRHSRARAAAVCLRRPWPDRGGCFDETMDCLNSSGYSFRERFSESSHPIATLPYPRCP